MLEPRNTKYKKSQKGGKKIRGYATSGAGFSYGSYGLKATSKGRINSRQIEAARKVISRFTKKTGKLWIRVFPDIPVTKKPQEVRMGSGKGSVDSYVLRIKPGRMIFEIDGVSYDIARDCLIKAGNKLPFTVKFIKNIY